MKLSKISLTAFFILAQLPASGQSLERVFTKRDRLVYHGYEITRSAKPGAESWTITIKKNGKTVERFEIGDTWSKDWARIGLFNFLGGRRKQLIVEEYTGGMHCCWQYRIIDLSPTYRVLYDSNDWDVGYPLKPVDLNKDGVFEFTQSVMAFDNFYLSHARSPFPDAIFKYDKKSGEYLPANPLFPGKVTKNLKADLVEVARLSRNLYSTDVYGHEEYVAATLRAFLKRVYAGRETQAWAFFDAEYKLDNKQELRSAIREALRGCLIYDYIYPRRK
jgi:hypothetical protein